MDKKLTEKELLGIFNSWRRIIDDKGEWDNHDWHDEEAHNQIKSIIKTWYKYNLWDLKVGVVE